MNTRSINLAKVNSKSAILILVLALSMFSMGMPLAVSTSDQKISSILAGSPRTEAEVNVLITTATNDYAGVKAEILDMGGEVAHEFHYVNAISASVPAGEILALTDNKDVTMIYKDETRFLAGDIPIVPELDPEAGAASAYLQEYESTFLTPEMIEGIEPNNYWNPIAMGAEPVWYATDDWGQGSMVVIIDTGLYADHFMFGGSSIIGGIDLSYDEGDPTYGGWSNVNNHWHGTHVAGIIASTGGIVLDETDLLVESIEYHTGMSLPEYAPGYKVIWLLGMAPAADLYSIKVFDHTGGGVPESMVIAAMEYALDLKLVHGYDVDAISMSLGGGNLYDGRDVEDQLVDYITSHGITLVAAAGNDGPAQMTVGSPGSANTAITVGAAATPVQTRVYWDVAAYGVLGIGDLLFTSETPQIYSYSSRGPTSDGRLKPTLSATGIMVMSAYNSPSNPQGIAWASGTSMACPAVSGTVALLNTYAEAFIPGATPEDYKQALENGAIWLDGYNEYDQGAGFLNAWNALLELDNDPSIGDEAKPLRRAGWLKNIANTPIRTWKRTSTYETDIVDLSPGHKKDFVFDVIHMTGSIQLDITDLDLGVDLGLNSLEVYIHSAKRTTYAYFVDSANVWGDASFLVTDYETTWTGDVTGVSTHPSTRLAPIEPGYVKIVIENDWTSYDDISCHVKITVKRQSWEWGPYKYVWKAGIIEEGENTGYMKIEVPENAIAAEIQLSWCRDWSRYPTSDLDMVVYWDEGYNLEGATWNSPERVILEDPTLLYVLVDGYSIHGPCGSFKREPYLLLIKFTLG